MPHGDPESYDILAEMTGLDPDVLRRLAEMELLDEEIADQMIQQQRGDSMSLGTGMPDATPVGRTVVAPHPLQYAAAGLKQGIGNYQSARSQNQIEALRRRKREQVFGGGEGGGY